MKFVEIHGREVMKLVKFDEVFMKFKKIENPGHPYDFVQVWVAGLGWSEQKKSKNGKASFFAPRVVVLTGAPPVPAAGTGGAAGAPGGVQGVPPSEAGGGTVPPAAQSSPTFLTPTCSSSSPTFLTPTCSRFTRIC
jgi:hypothetical protein